MAKFKTDKTKTGTKPWGSVNKEALCSSLNKALAEKTEGTEQAIKEVYAVLRSDDISNSGDWWGPHHEILEDGTVVLNKVGVIASRRALAGAKSKKDLTFEQQKAAADHLKKHYDELSLPWNEQAGEMILLQANITGEMRVEDVPLAPGVNLAALKAGDMDPLEVVVEIPPGKSKRGWNYLAQTMEKIVKQVARETAPGYLGHQKPEDLDTEFRTPVTHWVGAIWKGDKAYFRGVIDKNAQDLKRWVKGKRITQVSIFGEATVAKTGGEIDVIDYSLMSIDWTPLNRAGMETSIVAIGEMMDFIEPVNKIDGGAKMTLAEILAKLKEMGAAPRAVIGEMGWKFEDIAKEIAGEMWSGLQVMAKTVGEMAGVVGLSKDAKPEDVFTKVKELQSENETNVKVIGEIAGIFGLTKDIKTDDIVARVKDAYKVQTENAAKAHGELVDKVVGEMVTAEAARPIVKMMLNIPIGTDKEAMKKIVGEMLAREDVKKSLAVLFTDPRFSPNGGSEQNGMATKRVSI